MRARELLQLTKTNEALAGSPVVTVRMTQRNSEAMGGVGGATQCSPHS
jgi:hypothetical protein